MLLKYSSIFFITTYFLFCESAFVDTLTKCTLHNEDCPKAFMHNFLSRIAKGGVPELDMPPIDPMLLKNVTVKIIDLIEITLVEGQVKGIKDCVIENFVRNMEKGKAFLDITCNVTLKGKYKVYAKSPIVQSLVGSDTVHGEGNGKVKIVQLKLKIVFPFSLVKSNGDFYLKCKNEVPKYDFDVKGTIIFSADHLKIGEVEASKDVTEMMNQSWRILMPSFGKPFMDKVMEFLTGFVCKFHDKVPAKYYISDDLSAYLE